MRAESPLLLVGEALESGLFNSLDLKQLAGIMAALTADVLVWANLRRMGTHGVMRAPRYVDLLPDLPRTENGKVQKFKLRERGVGAQTWDRALNKR